MSPYDEIKSWNKIIIFNNKPANYIICDILIRNDDALELTHRKNYIGTLFKDDFNLNILFFNGDQFFLGKRHAFKYEGLLVHLFPEKEQRK